MNILGDIEAPFHWIGGKAKAFIDEITPQELRGEIGLFAHTFASNLAHDFGVEANTLTHMIVGDVWSVLKTTATTMAPQILSGKVTFAQAVATGVGALKSEAASVMMPALKSVAEQTITNWLPNLITTSLAVASANPTSPPVSLPVASQPVLSKP
jgi:hypothetical protein